MKTRSGTTDLSGKDAPASTSEYVGRFAPSPTGPLHFGSLVSAVASYLDARAHKGRWLLRIEDIDKPREASGAAYSIVQDLDNLQMRSDLPISWQGDHDSAYQEAIAMLTERGHVYPCGCSRSDIRQQQGLPADSTHGNLVYPGTCRAGIAAGKTPMSLRLNVDDAVIRWHDRPAGFDNGRLQVECLATTVGDFPLVRADKLWSYQLAVVVDDERSGVTDVIRGADLTNSTARQIYLQQCLGYRSLQYLHIPVVLDATGQEKLSKQTGATAIQTKGPTEAQVSLLNGALNHLQLAPVAADTLADFWVQAIACWQNSRWMAR